MSLCSALDVSRFARLFLRRGQIDRPQEEGGELTCVRAFRLRRTRLLLLFRLVRAMFTTRLFPALTRLRRWQVWLFNRHSCDGRLFNRLGALLCGLHRSALAVV